MQTFCQYVLLLCFIFFFIANVGSDFKKTDKKGWESGFMGFLGTLGVCVVLYLLFLGSGAFSETFL